MGAADGAFPDIYPEGNSVFTSDDVQRLAENDIELENDEARYSSAVLDAYKAMTLAGEKLFITFAGEKENASEYIVSGETLLPGDTVITTGNINLAHEAPVKIIGN